MRVARRVLVACVLVGISSNLRADSIWDLQAVDANGNATHPKVGADPTNPSNKVFVEGIALNYSQDYLNPNDMFQLYVQAEAPDKGGLAAWAGAFYQGGSGSEDWLAEFARFTSSGFKPGDRVRVEGYVAFMRGKTNINERHSAAPSLDFTITVLQADVGMPTPTVLPSISVCNYFDQTRSTGAEVYQATWCQFQNVSIASMPDGWGAGKTIYVTHNGTDTFRVLLSAMGDFGGYSPPAGTFSVTGIFDQEDTAAPFTDTYRLWVKNYSDFEAAPPVAEPTGCAVLAVGLAGIVLGRGRRRS